MTNHASTPASLLLRRAMHPDEWDETYLTDLIRRNGVRSPSAYYIDRVRGTLPRYKGTSRPSDLIDQLPEQLDDDGRPHYGSSKLPRWASQHRSKAVRYCPICMAKSRYIRTRWRIPLLPVCTLHGCYLKNNLVEPALTIRRKRSGLINLYDVSDEELMDAAVCCMPAEFAVACAVWAPLERAAEASLKPYADEALAELAGWTVLAWHLLERVASAHRYQVNRQLHSSTLTDITQLITDVRIGIAPNKQGVQAFVQRLTENVHCLAAARCLRAIMSIETRTPSVVSRLPLAELHDALLAAAPQMAVSTRPNERRFREESIQALSRPQAIDYLGVGLKVFNSWFRSQMFPNVSVHEIGRRKVNFIDRAGLKRAKRYLLSLICVESFLSEQGIDWPAYFALRNQGILEPVQIGGRRYLRRGDLSTMACRLELMSTPASADQDGQTYPLLGEFIHTLAHRQETFGAFVHAALEGQFPVYRSLDAPGLASFRVGHEGLAWIRNRRFIDRNRSLAHHSEDQMDLLDLSA